MVNIKVAVRIRPLSERELIQGEEKIVRKENNSVIVTNPKIPERQDGDSRQRTRRFTVDFCYDSTDPEGCTQESVYREIGSEVLRSMYEGYNSCVLAYGPSASGKTYTIMGLQSDPGLTPRLCEGLFEKLQEGKQHSKGGIRIQIVISFLEIYNEKVRDLLGSEETGATCGNFSLRVREHPKLGPYVQGLSQHFVTDKRTLLELLATGNRRRSTATTENNIHSSRSHAVFTIQFKQSDGENYETERTSKVHLVDLAGSERAGWAQDRARLQEGANINKSLVTLGNVISALAESCESGIRSKCWQPFVPYRDSVLTWLLKDTLGGNSNTIMIATISPASGCLNETVNTLRYAKRTKKIVNQPVVNEDPKIRTIRELRREIARLKGLLIFLQPCNREVNWEESRCGLHGNYTKETEGFATPESKWPEPEEMHNTSTVWNSDKEVWRKKRIATEGKGEEWRCSESSASEEYGTGVRQEKGDACGISDEKKSDVNGSVNDNFSHETQIFSDSLESLPSVFLKSGNSCDDRDDDASEKADAGDEGGETQEADARKPGPSNLTRGFCSCEHLWRKGFPEMLHRSRPDLIKGISTRSKESLPLGSSQSCTDVSNLSHSTSENSLNSSGSADVQSSGNKTIPNAKANKRDSPRAPAVKGKNGRERESRRSDDSETASKKKEKRSDRVEAVTSRLYVTGTEKKQSSKTGAKKDDEDDGGDDDEDGEPEEPKLCKRARMKLFDLSRKLAMAKKVKKTVDSDTQTDPATGTLRVKEKCVTTEPSGEANSDAGGTLEGNSDAKREPCVIMNQVFIPRSSNYVVECGKVVRIGAQETTVVRQESATQTSHGDRRYDNANTSPLKFNPREEDCFSEDSLDKLDFKNRDGHRKVSEEKEEEEARDDRFDWRLNLNLSRNSDRLFGEGVRFQNQKKRAESGDVLLNDSPLTVLVQKSIPKSERTIFLKVEDSNNVLGSRREENMSSENSFTSTDGAEMNSGSETSSEDFVFLESLKDKDMPPAANVTSDRELYTITENSELSDPGDGFSPVQRQGSLLKVSEEGAEGPKWTCGTEKELEAFDESERTRERSSPPGILLGNVRSNGSPTENEFKMKILAERPLVVTESLHANKRQPKGSNMARPTSTPITTTFTDCRPESKEKGTEILCRSEDIDRRKMQIHGCDFQPNSHEQFLNLNISNGDSSGRAPPFSVDTHLFGKPSKKDQSTDTMSTSADSITFVFMGPAKPKTSVLIELIQRSLGENFLQREIPFGQRRCKSRGVQCDAGLMRSVSVDTAMIALSRIAKNQEPLNEIQKTNSLGALSTGEISKILGGGKIKSPRERSCRCDAKTEIIQGIKEKRLPKQSVFDDCRKSFGGKSGKQEAEKPKKSVSWFGDAGGQVDAPEGGGPAREPRGSRESEVADSNPLECPPATTEGFDPPERRVRFLKPEAAADYFESTDGLSSFLKEATNLLKSINSRSSNGEAFSKEADEDGGGEPRRTKEDNRRGALRTKSEGMVRQRAGAAPNDESRVNLTWPRRRPTAGKPPTGTRPKLSKSLLHSRFDSSHSNGSVSFTTYPRTWSQSSRTGSSGRSWDLSNLSVAISNSCLGESQSRSSSSRSCCNDTKWARDSCSPMGMFAKSKPHCDRLSELEAELEECCRRLEAAAEHDEMRERIRESRKVADFRKGDEFHTGGGENIEKRWPEVRKPRETLKRRKTERCAGGCTCEALAVEPCKRLWSKGCRSSFELDSFGPGRTHCYQLCMFCRRKEEEIYYSALNLNSECYSDLCRLDYYGFCPCSPVKLKQVVPSPRAYMQHLLALRKQIVADTKHLHFPSKASRQEGRRDFSWLGRPGFSSNVDGI